MNKSELINDSLVELNVEARSKEEALKKVADLVLKAGCVKSAETYYHGMMEREKNSTTGFGSGIAIPHAKMEEVLKPAICVITLKDAVDWKAMDDKPVHLLIALAVPTEHEGSLHLKLLATLSENLMEEHFVHSLLSAKTKHEILSTITDIFTDKGEV